MAIDFKKLRESAAKNIETLESICKADVEKSQKSGEKAQSLAEGFHEDVVVKSFEIKGDSKFAPGFKDITVVFEKEGKEKMEYGRLPVNSVYTPTKSGSMSTHNAEFILSFFRAILSPQTTLSGALLASKTLLENPELIPEAIIGSKLNIQIGYGKFGSSFHALFMDDPNGSDKKVIGIGARRWDRESKTEFVEYLKDAFGAPYTFQSFDQAHAHGVGVQYYEKYSKVCRMSRSKAQAIDKDLQEFMTEILNTKDVVEEDSPTIPKADVPFSEPVVEEPTSAGLDEVDVDSTDDVEMLQFTQDDDDDLSIFGD